MTATLSPGPWTHDAASGQIRDRDGQALASVPQWPDGIGGPGDQANGRLMAAAPGMLAALWVIYKLTAFCFNPGPRDVAVSSAAESGLRAAGIDPASVWTAETMPGQITP